MNKQTLTCFAVLALVVLFAFFPRVSGQSSGGNRNTVLSVTTFANLPTSPNGTIFYCADCKNVTDDTTGTFDSAAAGSGHGTNVLRENGAWRVH